MATAKQRTAARANIKKAAAAAKKKRTIAKLPKTKNAAVKDRIDVLSFTNTANITGTWTSSTGTLALSGSDTVANYQAALRSVGYSNSSDNPSTATRTVTFKVNDGDVDSAGATKDVSVAVVNDAPVAVDDSTSITLPATRLPSSRRRMTPTPGSISSPCSAHEIPKVGPGCLPFSV